MNFKIVFHLDGCGVYYDLNEPLHLDAILAWALAPMQSYERDLERDDKPDDIQLPLLRTTINGHKVWHASALLSEQEGFETLRFWRKKFRQDRIDSTQGSPNLKMGIYREYNRPVPLLLISRLVAYASGNRKSVKKILKKQVKYLGKKRSYGYGRIIDIETREIEEDMSLVYDNIAMRWLPDENGKRLIRCSPPYWNNVGRVKCCEVGAEYKSKR